jgi:hypothetical protein
MRLTINVWKFALLVAAGWSVQASAQTAGGCGHGYDDNTCIPRISVAAQPQPQCSAAAGWTTGAPAVWRGNGWSSPQCNYTAPPTCASGDTEIAPPVWNGESWSAPACEAPPAPSITPQDQLDACASYSQPRDSSNFSSLPGDYIANCSSLGECGSGIAGTGYSAYWSVGYIQNAISINGDFGYASGFDPAQTADDMSYIYIGNPGGDLDVCFFSPNTTTVIGWYNLVAGQFYCENSGNPCQTGPYSLQGGGSGYCYSGDGGGILGC